MMQSTLPIILYIQCRSLVILSSPGLFLVGSYVHKDGFEDSGAKTLAYAVWNQGANTSQIMSVLAPPPSFTKDTFMAFLSFFQKGKA